MNKAQFFTWSIILFCCLALVFTGCRKSPGHQKEQGLNPGENGLDDDDSDIPDDDDNDNQPGDDDDDNNNDDSCSYGKGIMTGMADKI